MPADIRRGWLVLMMRPLSPFFARLAAGLKMLEKELKMLWLKLTLNLFEDCLEKKFLLDMLIDYFLRPLMH